jgi:hypothetical protein
MHLKPNKSFVRAQVDVKKQVAIAIYLLEFSAEYRTIENFFGVSTSTVCKDIPYTLQWCGVGKMTIETDSLPI